MLWLGTTITSSLQKEEIAYPLIMIHNSIKKRINAMKVLPAEMQKVGLKKGEFSESLMTKMSKEPQLPLLKEWLKMIILDIL